MTTTSTTPDQTGTAAESVPDRNSDPITIGSTVLDHRSGITHEVIDLGRERHPNHVGVYTWVTMRDEFGTVRRRRWSRAVTLS